MKKILSTIVLAVFLGSMFMLFGCSADLSSKGTDYNIPQLDLSQYPSDNSIEEQYKYLYNQTIVDSDNDYMAHPDSVLLSKDSFLTVYPAGHGLGEVLSKVGQIGDNKTITYSARQNNTPESWKESKETPTIYRLGTLGDSNDKYSNYLIMTSANPSWNGGQGDLYGYGKTKGNGFNASYSCDNGKTWTEFETYYGYKSSFYLNPIVAMASLTRLKENGQFVDKWMGIFHDYDAKNYSTILTFENGKMVWSKPQTFFAQYRDIEKFAFMCEVEVIRSDSGKGDELCLLGRSNSKQNNSLISFSYDEGKTWTYPKEVPSAYSGERHKAEWIGDRLFITFRSIERDSQKVEKYAIGEKPTWYSEGWIAWVGDWNDLKNGTEGQYRIKIAHTYLEGQTQPQVLANGDTGYCGNVVLDNGDIITSSYGAFDCNLKNSEGKLKTYITSKYINLADTDKLVALLFNK